MGQDIADIGPRGGQPGLRDAKGSLVPDSQPFYQALLGSENGIQFGVTLPNPNYRPNTGKPAPSPTPPHLQFAFDTIGQVIFRSIGHCRLPLRLIWVQGIDASGEWLDGIATVGDTPVGSTILQFAEIPSWVGVGVDVTGTFAIPPGTTVGSISGNSVALAFTAPFTHTLADIPDQSVIFFFSQGTATTTEDAGQGATELTFASGSVPPFVGKIPGVAVSGDFVPPGATVVTASDSQVGISAGLLAPLPAGAVITFSKGPTTVTLAAALCAPIDPNEEGGLLAFYSGSDLLFTPGSGVTPPPGWSEADQQQLIDSMGRIAFYPGTEWQLPDPLISSDKGAAVTNAFRGIRYIVIPDFPITGGLNLSVIFKRTNSIAPPPANVTAVQFAPGAA